jgi:hypothetical protein
MSRKIGRCWGGPLDGQMVPADRQIYLAPVFAESERYLVYEDPGPIGPTFSTIEYRCQRFAAPLRDPWVSDLDYEFTTVDSSRDQTTGKRVWFALWYCFIRDTDGLTRQNILGGMRLVQWLTA